MNDPRQQQVPAVYRRRVGALVITALSDGYVDVPFNFLGTVSAEEVQSLLAAGPHRAEPRISINAFLIEGGGRQILVDTGSGDSLGPTAGRLHDNLAVAGVDPATVDTILLTHMHPDHSNGLTDAEGRARFPNATLYLHAAELRHWDDDILLARATERELTRWFKPARFQLAPYRGRLHTFERGEILPGITALPMGGHTPGHCGFLVSSEGARILIWGDTVHVPEVQVVRPEVCCAVDIDPAASVAARRATFEMAATEGLLVVGMHVHFPGFAYLAEHNGRYVLTPEPWAFTL